MLPASCSTEHASSTPCSLLLCVLHSCRFRFCGAVLDGQLYVVGGMAAYEAPDAPRHAVSGSVMRYNPASNTWQTMKGERQRQQQQ